MGRALSTTDHDVIRSWAEARKGRPAIAKATQTRKQGAAGLLRIDFDAPEGSLEQTGWDEFFETFDANELAFLYQEVTPSGRKSRFSKFVSRDSVEADDGGERSSPPSAGNDRADVGSGLQTTGAKAQRHATAEDEDAREEVSGTHFSEGEDNDDELR